METHLPLRGASDDRAGREYWDHAWEVENFCDDVQPQSSRIWAHRDQLFHGVFRELLAQTPRPVRDATEAELRGAAEAMAEEDGKNRVGVETVIAAWVRSTPETLRADLPRQMERFGLDPGEYGHLL